MKHRKHFHNLTSAGIAPTDLAAGLNQTENNFTPSPDEVARKAYFTYVNAGCPEGCDVQHWLNAEAQIVQERDQTRIHGFHNRT